tara:strand:- start:560 stop:844 length:285 start_codon:yes stop_codon:yes gene_type:complete
MAFGYTKGNNTYKVRWQELVSYEIEVSAADEEEAHENALNQYDQIDNCINVDYWDGSIKITLEEEGEVEEDPDYHYKESLCDGSYDDPYYPPEK